MERPGRGTRAATNGALAFILGGLFFAVAIWASENDVSVVVVWAAIGIGLLCALPLTWYQLFE